MMPVGDLLRLYERVTLSRGDFRMMLAVAAHEARDTDESCMEIAESLIEVAREKARRDPADVRQGGER